MRHLPFDTLLAQIDAVLAAWGMPDETRRVAARAMAETDLMGVDSHGISMLPMYETLRSTGALDVAAIPRLLRETPATAMLDAGAGLGHPAAAAAMDLAIAKAKTVGIGAAGVVNSHHFGAAGWYARRAAAAGCCGIAVSSARGVLVLPTGGAEPMLGTNPFAFAAPIPGAEPFSLDMATSAVAANKVKVHALKGKDIPAGWVADAAGAPVTDGYRAAARTSRPEAEPAAVPNEALRQTERAREPVADDVVTVAITYTAVERDTWSPDDPIHRQGNGLLFLDRAGRAIVVTARSLVDGAFTETDVFGGDPDVDEEQIKVQLAGGSVHRAGRVWVDPNGADLAALVLDDVPPDLICTPAAKLSFDAAGIAGAVELRASGPNGLPLAAEPQLPAAPGEKLGGAVCSGGRAVGILGARPEPVQVVPLANVPADLRPQ